MIEWSVSGSAESGDDPSGCSEVYWNGTVSSNVSFVAGVGAYVFCA